MQRGTLTAFTLEPGSVYPSTPHKCKVYVPAQYPKTPAPYMVFLDGISLFLAQMNVPAVLDELIARGTWPGSQSASAPVFHLATRFALAVQRRT